MLKILETKVHLQPIHYLRLTDSLGIHIIEIILALYYPPGWLQWGHVLLIVGSPASLCWTQAWAGTGCIQL